MSTNVYYFPEQQKASKNKKKYHEFFFKTSFTFDTFKLFVVPKKVCIVGAQY